MLKVKVPEKHAAYRRAARCRMFLPGLREAALTKPDQDHFPEGLLLLWASYWRNMLAVHGGVDLKANNPLNRRAEARLTSC
jgi:hypothetical protein